MKTFVLGKQFNITVKYLELRTIKKERLTVLIQNRLTY